MSEEPTNEPTNEPAVPPVPLVDAEGNLRENWRESLDEDIREDPYIKQTKTFNALAKSAVHARRLVGADKMAIPKEESGQDVWDEYYKIGGRPETALDYNFTKPEEFPDEYYNQESAVQWMEFFHTLGLSTKQAKAIFDRHNTESFESLKAADEEIERNREEVKNKLYSEWGNATEQRLHFGNMAVSMGTGDNEEFRTRLTEKFGDDPDFIRFTSNLGSKFAEHGTVVPTTIPTPEDIQTKINEEMAKESYTNPRHPDHNNQVQKVKRLFEERAKSLETGFVK